ncbi:MAG: winged helix-turn-helix domain-containing protein, partial [Chloroflexota bacterium]
VNFCWRKFDFDHCTSRNYQSSRPDIPEIAQTEKLKFTPLGVYITQYADPALEIDLEKQVVKVHGEVVDLSPREFSLLACLVRDQGRIVSHRDLIREIWGEQYTMDSSLSSLYIYYLRKKLKDGKNGHQYIKTLWGRGYWFEPRPEE